MNSPKSSSSSSLSSSANKMMSMNILSRRKRETQEKNEGCKTEEKSKFRKESSPEVEILCEVEAKNTSIHDLPSEMLMKILGNLDFPSLLKCRLMSRLWTGMATDVCRSRGDLELLFNCYREQGQVCIMHKKRETSLLELIELFGSSPHFPFAQFRFDSIDCSTFHRRDWIKFLSRFKENIKGLKLTSFNVIHLPGKPKSEEKDLPNLIAELRDLLCLNQVPQLQEFGLHLVEPDPNWNLTVDSRDIRIFPGEESADNLDSDSNVSDASDLRTKTKPAAPVRLDHLKVLYLNEIMFSDYTGIVTDLLCASVKLEKIKPFKISGRYRLVQNFHLLHSLGKLDCLQSTKIDIFSKSWSKDKDKEKEKAGAAPLVQAFKLKTLSLCMKHKNKDRFFYSKATSFLFSLFESSKDTLRELTMDPLGFLEDLPLPQFSRLAILTIDKRNADKIQTSIFPPGIELSSIFPALTFLNLEIRWTRAFPHEDFISSIPTLRRLKIVGDDVNEAVIAQISFMCPDLKDFCIYDGEEGPLENFPEVGSAIWTHLTKLQYLELGANVESETNSFPAIDVCITGISGGNLERLYDLNEADRLMRKWGKEGRLLKSEIAPEAERENTSILNLKDLKNLTISLTSRMYSGDEEDHLYDKTLSLFSQEFAFKLMDNLTYKIKRHPKTTLREMIFENADSS